MHVYGIAAHSCLLFGGGGSFRRHSERDRHNNQRRRGWMLSNCTICVILVPVLHEHVETGLKKSLGARYRDRMRRTQLVSKCVR
jgi:hypothetical protein